MALPAMITGFGEQSANYGAVVGQSLQQLGQQVGQQLAMREYQKQAQAVLPALQQTYTSAMDKIQAGEVTEGYRDILNAQLQFGASQNPFIANMNQMAGSIAEKAASDFLKMKQYEIQYGRTGTSGGTGLPGARIPTTEEVIAGGFQDQGVGMDMGDGSLQAQFEDIDKGNEQELLAMREEGQTGFGFSLSKFIPPQEIRDEAATAINDYSNRDQAGKQDYITQIPETDIQPPEEGEEMEIIGVGFGKVVGPKAAPAPEGEEIVSKKSVYRGGEFGAEVLTKPKQKTAEQIAREDAQQKTFDAWVENYNTAKQMLQTNPQLRDIFEKAGNNIARIGVNQVDETTAQATIDGQPVGDLSVVAPAGMMSESMALDMIIKAPGLLGKGKGKYQFYKAEPTEAPAAPADVDAQAEQIFGVTTPTKETPTGAAAKPTTTARELTLEERIAAKTKTAAAPIPKRTATKEQLSGVKRSSLESEKTRLERSLYETPRAGGGRKLKRGLTAQDPDVKAALERISEINKQLEGI